MPPPTAHAPMTPQQRRDPNLRFEHQMQQLLPEGWTFGYLGNVGVDQNGRYDDRAWYIFVPHPGRVGGPDDKIGGFSTQDRFKLLDIARGIRFGRARLAEGR